MNVLFEEDGVFRAGSVLADNNTSLQVELPSGKRAKVKAANVLLRFASPSAADVIEHGQTEAEGIDIDFLWEVCGEDEFGFEELATDYHGGKPSPTQAASVLMRLHAAPMYFHRKGRGRYRKAPPEILKAALAGIEKKKQLAAAQAQMVTQLLAGEMPEALKGMLQQLLYQPDRNRIETKALEAACAETRESPAKLLQRCGALASTHVYRLGRFLFEYFPENKGGTDFPAYAPATDDGDLPLADVAAFSIDDAATTEIDDAFSIRQRTEGGWRIGIHIAAPGLGMAPESDLGRVARSRLSTVYMPGRKITMLPEAVIEQFTLAAGSAPPAVSLYLDVASDYRLLGHETRLERVPVVANLRHHDIEPLFNAETLANAGDGVQADYPYREELTRLWEFAQVLQAGRGKTAESNNRKDYNFTVDWAADGPTRFMRDGEAVAPREAGFVTISERPRGSPLDTLVAELMIVANATWGAMLRDAGIPALYRVQTAGKVRMSTVAAGHEGLGVDCYAWSSSPLRRYCDLLNQWQLIALLRGEAAPFAPKSAELYSALRDFELTYAAYADFQRGMERYWCLRWLLQHGQTRLTAHVLREALVRLDDVPLVMRLPSLPDLSAAPRGCKVVLEIDSPDLLEAEVHGRFLELAQDTRSDADFAAEGDEEGAE